MEAKEKILEKSGVNINLFTGLQVGCIKRAMEAYLESRTPEKFGDFLQWFFDNESKFEGKPEITDFVTMYLKPSLPQEREEDEMTRKQLDAEWVQLEKDELDKPFNEPLDKPIKL